ncbi:MAG: sugar ABC transporter permease [Chloroflexi bacterium]|nr:sugar ABC transporter permease [Chloroflexota bacterium]
MKSMGRLARREALECYLFIALAVFGFIVFQGGPIGVSAYLSMTDSELVGTPSWIGLRNYGAMLQDPLFWQSLRVTLLYAGVTVPAGMVLSLFLAMLMNQNVRGIAFFRTVYYLPSVISGVAVALLWRYIFNPEFGILNIALRFVGVTGPNWLLDPNWALPSLMLMSLWGIGGGIITYLAGLQGIPTELYEAVEIDGGGSRAKFAHVTVPLISPVAFFNLVTGIIWALQEFTTVYVMTQGGPSNATLFYGLYLYRNAFRYFDMGYASALAWVLLFIVLILTLILFRTARFWVHYER